MKSKRSAGPTGSNSDCQKNVKNNGAGAPNKDCIWDSKFCFNKYGQCAMWADEIEEKCGKWDRCSIVICHAAYKVGSREFCIAREFVGVGTKSSMWSWKKKAAPKVMVKTEKGVTGSNSDCQKNVKNNGAGAPNKDCIWDSKFCFNKFKQCAIWADEIEEKCGKWDRCSLVICHPNYKVGSREFCIAREFVGAGTASSMWMWKKTEAVTTQADAEELGFVQKTSGSIKKALPQLRPAKPVSFLQMKIAPVKAATTKFLATKSETSNSAAEQAKMEEVISFLRDESGKLSSPVLSVMAMRAAGDHFKKVEQMLQKLIQNLLSEENQDIAKSGFCDTEIAKANLDRDYAMRKVTSISAELQLFESDKEKLDLAIETGTKAISDLEAFAQNATENRQHDHRVNVVTLAETKEGIGMLNQAKALYGDAAASRGKMASQQSATPVATTDEQTLGSGSQEIVMLLTGISRNLDSMVTDLEKQEKDAQAAFASDMSDN